MFTEPALALRSHDASWNRERWEALPDNGNRYEVIGGVLYMSTAPSSFHQWIVRRIFLGLYQQIDAIGYGLTLWSPIGVFMPGCDPVQPDLLLVRAEDRRIFQHRRVEGVPSLLVEVLSPGNAATDTEVKRKAYARAGVPEYWVVRPSERDVLVYSQPDASLGDYAASQLFGSDVELESPTMPVHLPVHGFFAGAPDTTV